MSKSAMIVVSSYKSMDGGTTQRSESVEVQLDRESCSKNQDRSKNCHASVAFADHLRLEISLGAVASLCV
jgi:hypothetical protein